MTEVWLYNRQYVFCNGDMYGTTVILLAWFVNGIHQHNNGKEFNSKNNQTTGSGF